MPPIHAAPFRASTIGHDARGIALMLTLALSALLASAGALAATVQVDNLLDSGSGSLRDAVDSST